MAHLTFAASFPLAARVPRRRHILPRPLQTLRRPSQVLRHSDNLFVNIQSVFYLPRMAERDIRTYEVTFCSRVSKWADSIFANHPAWAFKRTEIEKSKLDLHHPDNVFRAEGEKRVPRFIAGFLAPRN